MYLIYININKKFPLQNNINKLLIKIKLTINSTNLNYYYNIYLLY